MNRWPDDLPNPQADSLEYFGADTVNATDVLFGPTRTRLARRHAMDGYTFAVWFTAEQAEAFESWHADVVAFDDGEFYAPWIGHGIVVAFQDEYEMKPLGRGWQLAGLLVGLRIDPTLCDDHIGDVFGLLRDPLDVDDAYKDDGASTDIYRDDFPLSLIASEPC